MDDLFTQKRPLSFINVSCLLTEISHTANEFDVRLISVSKHEISTSGITQCTNGVTPFRVWGVYPDSKTSLCVGCDSVILCGM